MPLYEYECSECGAVFEALQRNSRAPSPACQSCGSKRVRRRITAARAHVAGGESCERADVCRPPEECQELVRAGQCACPHARS